MIVLEVKLFKSREIELMERLWYAVLVKIQFIEFREFRFHKMNIRWYFVFGEVKVSEIGEFEFDQSPRYLILLEDKIEERREIRFSKSAYVIDSAIVECYGFEFVKVELR